MMTVTKRLMLGLSAAALTVGGIAYAQGPAGRPNPDADGNGVVTRAEAQASATAMFARLDANQDGKLDKTDRDARRTEMRGKMFDKLDADNNGAVSEGEFMADRGMRGDGGPGMDAPGKKGHGRHHRGGHGMMKMSKMADTNKDGAVSQAEFAAAAMKRFDMADANRDGQITQEERAKMHEAMKAKWQAKKGQAAE